MALELFTPAVYRIKAQVIPQFHSLITLTISLEGQAFLHQPLSCLGNPLYQILLPVRSAYPPPIIPVIYIDTVQTPASEKRLPEQSKLRYCLNPQRAAPPSESTTECCFPDTTLPPPLGLWHVVSLAAVHL